MFATFGGFHMRKILCAALCCAAVIVSGSAIADDSSASLAMGGLQFTKSVDIRMAREDLFLSPKAVRIRYEFTNDGARDVDTLVAFPLPDIDLWEFYEEPIGTVGSDPVNFVNFKAVADDKNVPVTVEQRAYLGNRDVTAIVNSVGLPVNVLLAGNIAVIDKLAPEKKKILEKAGLAEADAPDQEHPKWTVRTKFYWTQHFSAGKTVVLEHSYTPVTGQTFFVPDDLKPKNTGEGGHDWQKDYCMDAGTLSAIRARIHAVILLPVMPAFAGVLGFEIVRYEKRLACHGRVAVLQHNGLSCRKMLRPLEFRAHRPFGMFLIGRIGFGETSLLQNFLFLGCELVDDRNVARQQN